MRERPRLLDLFSGAGGAAVGYHRAGFEVVGVDIRSQPRYPFEHHVADALTFPLDGFDAVHASPPCQAYSIANNVHSADHPDLLALTRDRLEVSGLPWVIENVPGAPMRPDMMLCGSTFPQLRVGEFGIVRHRWFELWQPTLGLAWPCQHPPRVVSVFGYGAALTKTGGRDNIPVETARRLMGIDWMNRDELSLAIPPAYTEHIGGFLLDYIRAEAA